MPVKGQIILIMVIALTFALFSFLMLLSPIKDKLLKVKDMETVYQAITNSEKGLEASLLYKETFGSDNLELNVSTTISKGKPNCGDLNKNIEDGDCYEIFYEPSNTSALWKAEEDKFKVYYFLFYPSGTPSTSLDKMVSDGFRGKNIRTFVIRPSVK
jgi:hypothetical protein